MALQLSQWPWAGLEMKSSWDETYILTVRKHGTLLFNLKIFEV
jgi:hypothetical protein